MCDCSSKRKDEDRVYTITVKAFIDVDACCEEGTTDIDESISSYLLRESQ